MYYYDKNYWLAYVENSFYHSDFCAVDVEYNYDNMLCRKTEIVEEQGSYNPEVIAYTKTDGKTYSYSTANGKSLQYDDNGNLIFIGSGIAGKYFEYDYNNQMVRYYDTTSVGTSQAEVTFYEYDSFGRRVSKSRATGTDSTSGSLYEAYSYAGDRVIADYNGDGDIRYRFIYGEGIDEVVCMMKTTVEGQKRYFGYFTDALGSITTMYRYNPHDLTAPNRVVQWYEYDAYGNVDIQSDSAYTVYGSQYMFTGRRYDKESGLYYYRARYYNPELGIFQSHDPLGYIDSMNLYAYCGNNPTNFVDPWGLRTRNEMGGWNYDYQETRDIIKKGENGKWSPFDHVMIPYISPDAEYDYKAKQPDDTFTVPGEQDGSEKKNEDMLTASEFGNYIAGYLAQYHWGTAGWIGMRAGGHLYGYIDGCDYYEIPMVPFMLDQWEPIIWDFDSFLDDPDSIRDINRGKNDAINGAWN